MHLEETKQSEDNKSCKSCGAELNYQPGSDFLKCTYCGYREEIQIDKEQSILELDLKSYLSTIGGQAHSEEITMVHCNGCGANQHIGDHIKTQHCVFCGSILTLKDQQKEEWILPGAIIPFFIDDKKAKEEFNHWVKGLWFAPNKFKKATLNTNSIQGVYIPFWTFDANMNVQYSGEQGTYYYENKQVRVQVNGKTEYRNQQVRKTRWFPASGSVNGFIDDTLIIASDKRKINVDEKVSNWDLSKTKAFDPKYLAGYITEKYTIPLNKGHFEAKKHADNIALKWAKQDIGGDTQRVHHLEKILSDETFKHILLPLYMSTYAYSGKVYKFHINGQTGRLSGERPYSIWKIIFTVLLVVLVIGSIVYFTKGN